MMKLTVHLGPRSYPVIFGRNCAFALPAQLKKMFPESRFGLVTNTTLARLYKKQIAHWKKKLDLTVHVMPDGERYKTIETWSRILDTFLAAKFERSGVLIAFGGGVVGDVTGFAAASLLRGVAYVQVPTTLLAMVDSSVGGKTGLDHACGKNLVGAFHQPSLVWIDTAYLESLSQREYIAGLAELFKYGFIGGRGMFDFVSKNRRKLLEKDDRVLLEGIRRSIEIKAHIVEQDEHETAGKRMLLNLGHTFGHALEKSAGFRGLRHGEAVWWGLRCAVELGKLLKTIPAKDAAAYDALLAAMPQPKLSVAPSAGGLYSAMRFDKKVAAGKIRFVVPAKAGMSVVKSGVTGEVVKRVIKKVLSKTKA
ncbi:MAG: 3-dehydroquinate synthase [Chitinispirillaceae bacterium]|nr:3-dehydroquinate synthase [Chitinispirillaceae bacterium]